MPNLNLFVDDYTDADTGYAPYQPGCGGTGFSFELHSADSDSQPMSLVERVIGRMKAPGWVLDNGDHFMVSRTRGLNVKTFEEVSPSGGKWKKAVFEFDGGSAVQAKFWADFRPTSVVIAQSVSASQASALSFCSPISAADVDRITGYQEAGVLEVAVALATNVDWRGERFTGFGGMTMQDLIRNLMRALPHGLSPSELEICIGLAGVWEDEAEELVAIARSLDGAGRDQGQGEER